ncbi:hypothetical protein CHRY9390_00392 [Chryseobacterium aquaeductus]|uniref:Lipoprotein n=1 Tax=Chryseobacterium aquaeductus TaxID=2675056 RepID=A0A9N8MFL4_9FLAO|nr:hypothetical protein [Chryseobacterium aquaeductus]CAA7329751.1 hypothetical protein CHRY9390_00392 [Chryseobacterium potabilaquae]CAD7798827.1 hypothetical protein CHRY9390_00392 [Chryseobacterium aquaeductus]
MFYKIIISSFVLLFLANCKAQKDTKNSENVTAKNSINKNIEGKIIYFAEGENKFLKEYEMNVTFKNISEDSRCPEGVTCVWQGAAVANIEFMGTYTRPMTIPLATTENAGRNYHKSTVFNGYTISLVEVNPAPSAGEGAKPLAGKYRIGIVISKGGEDSTNR